MAGGWADRLHYCRTSGRRANARVSLLEHGLLLPGQVLCFDRLPDRAATVLADGSLRLADGPRGSIHEMGALVSNTTACNSWEHWYYQDKTGILRPIDALREQVQQRARAVDTATDETQITDG